MALNCDTFSLPMSGVFVLTREASRKPAGRRTLNRTGKIVVTALVALFAAVGGYCLLVQHVLQSLGQDLPKVVEFSIGRLEEAMKPIRDADMFARYSASTETFTVGRTAAPHTTSELSEPEFIEFIRSSGVPDPKVIIIYLAAEFPELPQRNAFESRVRAELISAGASSVTFGAQFPVSRPEHSRRVGRIAP